jgi:uncharacterized protein (DUF736 family)
MASQRSVKLGEFMMDEKGILHGVICGLGIGSTDVISEEATSHDGRPYLKLIADPLRTSYEVGAAFPKMKDGMEYYSAHLESPLFAAPLSAALFPSRGNEGIFNLVWNRPETPKPAVEADANAGQVQGHRHKGVTP